MSMSDTLGDMLTRIRNGLHANKAVIEAPSSKFRSNVLGVLKREGYIRDFKNVEERKGVNFIKIDLKYFNGNPVIKRIKRISKPGRRVYSRSTSIPKVMNGLGLAILSTPKGVMSDAEARKNNVGGEVICRVF